LLETKTPRADFYELFTVAAALMRLMGFGIRRNALCRRNKLTELRMDVDIKIALLTALISIIAFFSHRQWPRPASEDRDPT
jgi:hypothetical protein